MRILTAGRAFSLIDGHEGRLWLGFFVVADDADDVLPPVDVVLERGLAEVAGTGVRMDVQDHLKTDRQWVFEFRIFKKEKKKKRFLRFHLPELVGETLRPTRPLSRT